MIKENIQQIKNDSLRITTTVLFALLNNQREYCLSELADSLHYPSELIVSIIRQSLNQNIFEFYVGNRLITHTNIDVLLNDDLKDAISVVSKASLADKDSYERFNALIDNYHDSLQKNRIAKNIMIINDYSSFTPPEDNDFLPSIRSILSDLKTTECICKIDFTSFFPFALYQNWSNRQEYLVSLFQTNDTWEIRFFPAECVLFKDAKPQKLPINKVFDTQTRIIALNMVKKIWGPHDILLSEEPISVNAIVHDESCIRKIRHDISNKEAILSRNNDNTYSLTLKVLGLESFKSWILCF